MMYVKSLAQCLAPSSQEKLTILICFTWRDAERFVLFSYLWMGNLKLHDLSWM